MSGLHELGAIGIDANHTRDKRWINLAKGNRVSPASTKGIHNDNPITIIPSLNNRFGHVGYALGHMIGNDLGCHRVPSFGIQLNAGIKSGKESTPLTPILVVDYTRVVRVGSNSINDIELPLQLAFRKLGWRLDGFQIVRDAGCGNGWRFLTREMRDELKRLDKEIGLRVLMVLNVGFIWLKVRSRVPQVTPVNHNCHVRMLRLVLTLVWSLGGVGSAIAIWRSRLVVPLVVTTLRRMRLVVSSCGGFWNVGHSQLVTSAARRMRLRLVVVAAAIAAVVVVAIAIAAVLVVPATTVATTAFISTTLGIGRPSFHHDLARLSCCNVCVF